MALATANNVKAYLGVQGVADDAVFADVVAAAEAYFYKAIHRQTLEAAAFTETRDGNGKDVLLMYHWPVLTLTSLVIDGAVIPSGMYETGMEATMDARMLYLTPASNKVFSRGRRNVQITGTAGYTSVPADVKQAVVEIASRMYQKRKRIDEVSKQVGGETVSFSTQDLTDFAKRIINEYSNKVPM